MVRKVKIGRLVYILRGIEDLIVYDRGHRRRSGGEHCEKVILKKKDRQNL